MLSSRSPLTRVTVAFFEVNLYNVFVAFFRGGGWSSVGFVFNQLKINQLNLMTVCLAFKGATLSNSYILTFWFVQKPTCD